MAKPIAVIKVDVPDDWAGCITERYFLPDFNRHVHIQVTLFGSERFCLTDEGTEEAYELNWCMGKNDFKEPIFKAINYALKMTFNYHFAPK